MKIKSLLILLLIGSCAPTIRNFDNYQKQFINKSSFMPSKENLEGKLPKVAVFALDENNNEVASRAALGTVVSDKVEKILSQNKLAAIVDRKAAAKLEKEIALAEMKKTGSYKGPQIADFAISGSISNAGFTSKYSSGSTYFDPKTKNLITIPPSYKYSSEVSGNLKIYELPSLAVVQVIEFNDKQTRSENVSQDGGLNFGGLQIGGEKAKATDRDDNLVRKTGITAIEDAQVDLQNAFSKRGYILEKRIYDKKSIFKISLGSADGIGQGDKFEVSGQYESENPITNEVETETRIIASGVVSDRVDPKSSFVIIDDPKKSELIRLGDMVRMKYKKSQFSKFVKTAKLMAP
jgi:hypothetical protein